MSCMVNVMLYCFIVCQGYRLTTQDNYFGYFWDTCLPCLKKVAFSQTAGAIGKISLSRKPDHGNQI